MYQMPSLLSPCLSTVSVQNVSHEQHCVGYFAVSTEQILGREHVKSMGQILIATDFSE